MINSDRSIIELKDKVTAIRRELHKIPEAGFNEYKTTEFILNYLRGLSIEAEVGISGTGVIGLLKGKTGQKTIAFRADIDALSVEEQTGLEFCSVNKGYMHACGHDGHMAILLGFAELMHSKRSQLEDNILFIFQPAEEGPGGAEPIVETGLLEKHNVKCIFGLHIYPDIEEGKIGCKPGPMMAQTGEFDIYIRGKGAHGAMPHKGTDALLAAAATLTALNTVISRNIDPLEPAVLTVGRMAAGERRNIIAEEAVLEGTIRAFNEDVYKTVRERLVKLLKGISEAFDCTVEYEIRDMYPAVNNDEALFKLLADSLNQEDFIMLKPLTISEDFSYYQKKVPGLFFMLGSRNEAQNMVYSLHNNKFNFNEDILLTGMQVMYKLFIEAVNIY